jgi:hypothetical protein
MDDKSRYRSKRPINPQRHRNSTFPAAQLKPILSATSAATSLKLNVDVHVHDSSTPSASAQRA